jgi:hypothetical protein
MLTVESAKNPVFADVANKSVMLTVKFTEMTAEVPFLAMADDVEPWGKELLANAIAGKYGAVAAYVAPPEDPAIAERKAIKDSAIAKLKTLGLTEDEALSLI